MPVARMNPARNTEYIHTKGWDCYSRGTPIVSLVPWEINRSTWLTVMRRQPRLRRIAQQLGAYHTVVVVQKKRSSEHPGIYCIRFSSADRPCIFDARCAHDRQQKCRLPAPNSATRPCEVHVSWVRKYMYVRSLRAVQLRWDMCCWIWGRIIPTNPIIVASILSRPLFLPVPSAGMAVGLLFAACETAVATLIDQPLVKRNNYQLRLPHDRHHCVPLS